MKHSVENPIALRMRVMRILLPVLLGIAAIIGCKINGGGGGPDATGTFGADQFHAQLTAIAGDTATFGADQFQAQLTAQANPINK